MSSCSTRSPLESRILSPRGTTIGGGGGGVGLGIVAALEKCGAVGGSVAVKSVLKPCSTLQADFLSLCHLCRKMLQGRDIYMYRGEKAFCSDECRCRQIIMDERKEKCISKTSTCGEVSSSEGKLFFTEIIASS